MNNDDYVFDDSENSPPEHDERDDEEQPDSSDLTDNSSDPFAETRWIDGDADYVGDEISVVRRIGTKGNISRFINGMITRRGTIGKIMSVGNRMSVVKLIRSFIALTDGNGVRPSLNNEDGLKIILGTKFSRGGAVRAGGLTTILSYNDVDVRMINTGNSSTTRTIIEKQNVGSPEETEFNRLLTNVLSIRRNTVESLSDETGLSSEAVSEVLDSDSFDEVTYTHPTPEMIESMVREKNKHYKKPKPGESIGRLIKDLNNTTIFDGTGNDSISLPGIPGSVIRDIAESSVSEISERLHERVGELTEQEVREFSGILNPRGDADTKIEALDQMANDYRLKALREADPLKERLYKNIQGVAELKSDLIRIVEKGGAPVHSEARVVFEEEVDGNESIRDLSRLERFKKWIKKNWLAASSLAVGLAGFMTTLIIGLRHNIKRGANAVGSFGRSVYNAFRKLAEKLGPVLGRMITALGSLTLSLLKYGAMGLAWLASNLWVLVLAFVLMVYDRYGKK